MPHLRNHRSSSQLWPLGLLLSFSLLLSENLQAKPQVPSQTRPPRTHPQALTSSSQMTEQPRFKGIWEPANYNQDIRLTDVFFVTREMGYVSGFGGTIAKTVDGGRTWTAQLGGDPQSQEPEINHLRFLDRTHGWAVQAGDPAKLLRTVDGENWEQAGALPRGWGVLGYQFVSPSVGVLLDGNNNVSHIFRTIDGGRNWKEVFPPEGCKLNAQVQGLNRQLNCTLWTLNMVSPSVGYILGRVGYEKPEVLVVAKTVDGGATWSLSAVQGPGAMFDYNGSQWMSAFFTDQNNAVLATGGDRLYATSDGGQTLRGLTGTAPGPIQFADPEVGWSFNAGKLSYTADGGKRWSSRQFSFPAWAYGFSLPRRDRAYVVGEHGMVYRYSVIPVTYQAAAHSIDAPVMPGFDSPVFAQVATLNDVVGKLRAKVSATASGPVGSQTLPPSADANTVGGLPQNAGAPSSAAAGSPPPQAAGASATGSFQQTTDTTGGTVPQSGGSPQGTGMSNTGAVAPAPGVPSGSNPPGAGSFQQTTDTSGGAFPQSGGFQQDLGTGPVPGGYVDSCCGPLIQQLETTANTFATTVPSFSARFRNLNLILEGLNFLNSIVNQANTLKHSIRALRQAKSAQAAAAALNSVQAQITTISSSGSFVQDTTLSQQQ